MKAVKDSTVNELEEVALMGCKAIRAYLVYQGDNKQYHDKAKVGSMAVTSYTRLRATEANRMALEMMASRQAQKALTEGDGE
jgi:hypothetical protein